MTTPFIILALPRSRTYWLSRFLSYGGYQCGHEQARYVRGMDDVRSWLSQEFVGTAETAAARWWRLVHHYRPDIRVVVVRRSVDDAVESLMKLDMRGVCTFDRVKLARELRRQDRALDQIERGVPGVLSVRFDDLVHERVCASVFEHCLPHKHDPAWWVSLAGVNMQCDMPALMRYAFAHKAQLARAATICRQRMYVILNEKRLARHVVPEDGVVIQEEALSALWRDGKTLFAEHCLAVGEAEDEFLKKNATMMQRLADAGCLQIMTARCNGRIFGYLASIVGPSLEWPGRKCATQTTFFASSDIPGLGMRLQRASLEALRRRHVDQVIMRAGVRGAGPRLGVMYRRLGAVEYGQLFNLRLEAA